MTPPTPKVSVSLVTYNHAKYIAQALDGALTQETTFEYEILVGEDDSSDGTREIVKEYAEKYPDKIRLFLNDRKNVIYVNGKPTGRWNLMNNLAHSRGEYIALLEGDDYWTSPHKLQKQVDFLEDHRNHSCCYHPVQRIDEQGEIVNPHYGIYRNQKSYVFEDLFRGNFIPTCSILFRSGIEKNLPAWFTEIPIADWALHLLNAKQGNIGYIEDVMGRYRMHAGGVWAGITPLERAISDIKTFTLIGSGMGLMKNRTYRNSLSERYLRLSLEYEKQQMLSDARDAARQGFRYSSQSQMNKAIRRLKELYFPFTTGIRNEGKNL